MDGFTSLSNPSGLISGHLTFKFRFFNQLKRPFSEPRCHEFDEYVVKID